MSGRISVSRLMKELLRAHLERCFLLLYVLTVSMSGVAESRKLTIDDAIRLAGERSYDSMVARLNFMSQYWNYRAYRAELLPAVNLYGDLLQFDRSMVSVRNYEDGRVSYVENNTLSNRLVLSVDQNVVPLGGTLSVQSSLYRLDQFSYDNKIYNTQPLRLQYNQPLRSFNELKWRKKVAPVEYEKAKRAYLESMENVTLRVATLYFYVLAEQSVYQQSVRNLKDREYFFGLAKERFGWGTLAKSELLQLELSLLNAQMDVSNNEISLNERKFQLFSFLRIFDFADIELVPPYTIPDIFINSDDVISMAMENSSHTLEQQVQEVQAEMAVARAKAATGVQVQLNAGLGFNQTADNFPGAYRNLRDNEVVGFTLQLPVFDWGLKKGKLQMARADMEASKVKLEQEHESYIQNLRTSVLRFNAQVAQCHNAQRAQDIAEERYDIMKQRFESGLITVTDLNTAQHESDGAMTQYIRQLSEFWYGYYTLRQTTLFDWIKHRKLDADFEQIIKNKPQL